LPNLQQLIESFISKDLPRQPRYKEDWVRSDYIEPLYHELGWDRIEVAKLSTRSNGFVRQSTQTVDGSDKEPDYAFYVDGKKVLYIEAKKPNVRLATDRNPAYQIRRYSWNAGHPVGIVTNFGGFAIYATSSEPSKADPASRARVRYLTCDQYATEWDWLQEYLRPERVVAGSLFGLADEAVNAPARRPVDNTFLADMETWRRLLAADIYRNNRQVPLPQLNLAVQAIIDRLVFLSIAEARGLEEEGALAKLVSRGTGIYADLQTMFQHADARYNSGLFHFKAEVGRHEPDTLTPTLTISDEALRAIIQRLVPSESPYEFSILPVEILGHAYERFLGNAIIERAGSLEIVPKPEVKKAGGIYYTPRFVAEYIVRTTLDKLLQGRGVTDAQRLRIVDPACGSGSFLLAAYEYLLDWHLARYVGKPTYKSRIELDPSGRPRLSATERKRILLNNIYGVDVDQQAVEVAKLSLLLKVIEGETQLAFNIERLLPDLDDNIRHGNALIGPDYFSVTGATLDDATINQIAPFDWKREFPQVFQVNGGFDAVIGNPPYFSVDSTWGRADPRLSYLKRTYGDIYRDKTDVLFYFLKRAVDICNGEVAVIVSRAFLEAQQADRLREWLAEQVRVREILDFRNAQVFPRVGIATSIVRVSKANNIGTAVVRQLVPQTLPTGVTADRLADERLFRGLDVRQNEFSAAPWVFSNRRLQGILDAVDAAGTPVNQILHVGQGMQTAANDVFGGLTKSLVEEWEIPDNLVFQRARNSDLRRWYAVNSGQYILYLEDVSEFSSLPKAIRSHLLQHREQLEARAAFRRGDCLWWKYSWPLHQPWAHRPRIFAPYMASISRFSVDMNATMLGLTDTVVLYDDLQGESLYYITAILNSSLMELRHKRRAKFKGNGIYEYFDNTVGQLPIVRQADGSTYDNLSCLAAQAEEAAYKAITANTPQAASIAAGQQAEIEAAIDEAVFDLYGLDGNDVRAVLEALADD